MSAPLLRRVWQYARPRHLHAQIAWLGALVLAAAITALTWQTIRDQTELGREALESEARALAASLAAGGAALLVTERYSEIEQLLVRNARFPSVLHLQFLDRNGRVLSDVPRPAAGAEPVPRYDSPRLSAPVAPLAVIEYDADCLVVWQPVEAGTLLGWVRLEYSLDHLDDIRARLLRNGTIAAIAAIGVSIALFLTFLLRPMRALRRATAFAGQLDERRGERYRVEHDAAEIERLGEALDRVSLRLAGHEQVIAATGKRLAAVLQHAIDGILTLDERGRVESANPAAEQLLRARPGELTGMRFALLVPDLPLGLDELEDSDPPPLPGTGGVRITCETVARRMDGSECPVMVGATQMTLEGRVLHVVVARDISEQKHLERMKDNFMGSVSHELRTPLTALHGSLGLLAEGQVEGLHGDARALVDIAYKNSGRLVRLVNDILDFRNIESGELAFDMHVTALAPLLQELVRANESYARQQGVALELRVRDDPLSVWVDRERLAQALQKLLDNAIKLSPASAPVSILAERHGGLVRIAVTDRGPGIPEEFRQFVFQKFVQVDAADIRYRAGTGMGLSLARAIVERLGGSLDYVSGAKQGTTFYLDLPEAEAAAAQGR